MRKKIRTAVVIFITIILWLSMGRGARADVELTDLKQMNLGVQPVDVAASADGKLIFILAPGKLLVYSISKEKITNRISIAQGFDRITLSGRADTLILTSSASNTMKLMHMERIYDIDVSGLPVNGPVDAPVTITVFDDYQ